MFPPVFTMLPEGCCKCHLAALQSSIPSQCFHEIWNIQRYGQHGCSLSSYSNLQSICVCNCLARPNKLPNPSIIWLLRSIFCSVNLMWLIIYVICNYSVQSYSSIFMWSPSVSGPSRPIKVHWSIPKSEARMPCKSVAEVKIKKTRSWWPSIPMRKCISFICLHTEASRNVIFAAKGQYQFEMDFFKTTFGFYTHD